MIRISQIRLNLKEDSAAIEDKIAKKLKISKKEIKTLRIYKESIDARKNPITKVYTVDFEVNNEMELIRKHTFLSKSPDLEYKNVDSGDRALLNRPVVIGFGPAGMFSALLLAQAGYKPLVFERGEDVDKRTQTVEEFWATGILNTESNVQFGEGGAGSFSDGKLTTRIKDMRCRKVLAELIEAGAPEEILYKNKPHIGTDLLKPVVKKIREKIMRLGGNVYFESHVTDIEWTNGSVKSVVVNGDKRIETQSVVLAVGHSARDTFEMLHEKGLTMQAKPFAVGVRIEHPQKMIDQVQYKSQNRPEGLGAAEYALTYRTRAGRGVYSFCMCPGGEVVGAASEKNRLVVNGMSEHARAKENANSALLVTVTPEDFGNDHPLAGIKFQRALEEAAFIAGGGDYTAPIQTVGGFLQTHKGSKISADEVLPSYRPKTKHVNLRTVFPEFIADAIDEGIRGMNKKLDGFARQDAILTAVESRSSSPVRIDREEENLQSTSVEGLYPCGEGAGYAGGIMSSAVDGIKVAEKIISRYMKPLNE